MTLQQNEIRDIAAKLLTEVYKDLRVEPSLLELNGEEETMRRKAKNNNNVRLDVSARRIWV